MNDCIWSWVRACNGKCKCEKYISVNTQDGFALMQVYEHQTNKALEPITEDWKEMFEKWEV